MTFKVFIIAACVLFAEASDPDVLSKRDNAAVEVDPYAAYYEQYANSVAETQQQPVVPFTQYVSEKQGFAGAMENALGPDAGIVLGTIGAILGSLAVVGIGINANNVHSLSTDQDSICSAVKTLGAIDVSSASTTDTTTGTELNALITAIEAVSTPSC